jgi:hypothetical protein
MYSVGWPSTLCVGASLQLPVADLLTVSGREGHTGSYITPGCAAVRAGGALSGGRMGLSVLTVCSVWDGLRHCV